MAHRSTLIICEKPHHRQHIAPFWQERFPDDQLSFFYTPPFGSFVFDLPRDIPISSVPLICPTRLKRAYEDGGIFDGDFPAMVDEADHVVCATDPDPQGMRNFLDLIEHYGFEDRRAQMGWVKFQSFDPDHIRPEIARERSADDIWIDKMAGIGRAKQRFDFLYMLNALPVFGRTLRAAGVDVSRFGFLSKYSLQTLYLIERYAPERFTEGRIARMMKDNPAATRGNGYDIRLGSPITSFAIFNGLVKNGCLEQDGFLERGGFLGGNGRREVEAYRLADRGRRLLDLMHKDCFDPDLAMRINEWGRDWPASEPRIERYIRTFFGKQVRYLDRKLRA